PPAAGISMKSARWRSAASRASRWSTCFPGSESRGMGDPPMSLPQRKKHGRVARATLKAPLALAPFLEHRVVREVELEWRHRDVILAQRRHVRVVFGVPEGKHAVHPEIRPPARVLALLVRVRPRPRTLAHHAHPRRLFIGP